MEVSVHLFLACFHYRDQFFRVLFQPNLYQIVIPIKRNTHSPLLLIPHPLVLRARDLARRRVRVVVLGRELHHRGPRTVPRGESPCTGLMIRSPDCAMECVLFCCDWCFVTLATICVIVAAVNCRHSSFSSIHQDFVHRIRGKAPFLQSAESILSLAAGLTYLFVFTHSQSHSHYLPHMPFTPPDI